MPLTMAIRETSDAGLPIVATQPDSEQAKIYKQIARTVWTGLTEGARRAAPRIVVE